MHDPMTVAHRIKSPFSKKTPFGTKYQKSLITIWHVDPCTDHTDDSCGWFIRSRHADQKRLASIRSEFEFQWKHNYWWNENGSLRFSPIATLLMMYRVAAYQHFKNWNKVNRFVSKHLTNIILFAENETDCIFSYRGTCKTQEQASEFAAIVYPDILRKIRPWYLHPKWHINHWKIQIHWPAWMKRKNKNTYSHCDHNLRETI